MNILVTGAGGDIGQSVIKCLRGYNRPLLGLVGCDIDPNAARGLLDTFVQSPRTTDVSTYLWFLKDTIQRYRIQYVYPVPEKEIELVSQHNSRAVFGDATPLVLNRELIDIFTDKYRTVEFFRDHEIPYPETYLIDEYDGELEYPFLIKPRKSWGGKGVAKIEDKDDLDYYRKKMPNAIVQEIIGTTGDEYTVGVFSDGVEVYMIAFRRYLGYGSMSKYVELSHNTTLANTAVKIAKCCGLTGPLNIQFRKYTGYSPFDIYVPFEVNARISSTAYFRHLCGFHDVNWWIDLQEKIPIKYELKPPSSRMVRIIGEEILP